MAFGIEPQFWLNLQTQFDLETIRRELGERLAEIVSRLPEAAAARPVTPVPLQFRKRIKLLPGVHLNIGKTGVSVSAGVRAASVTWGRKRMTVSGGVPGTGLYARETLKVGSAAPATPPTAAEIIEPARPPSAAAYRLGRWIGRHWLVLLALTLAAGAAFAYLHLR